MPLGAGAHVGALLERDEVAPVAELDAAVRRGRGAEPSTVSDETVAPAKSPLAVAAAGRAVRGALDRRGRDLAAEEAERLHLLVAAATPAVPESLEAEALIESGA